MHILKVLLAVGSKNRSQQQVTNVVFYINQLREADKFPRGRTIFQADETGETTTGEDEEDETGTPR